MPPFKDLVGERFSRLVVVELAPREEWKYGNGVWWICRCDCGKRLVVRGASLRTGDTQSCGCLGRERRLESNLLHGLSRTSTHRIWTGIKQRCVNPNNTSYAAYGGRGIRVSERWLEPNGQGFANFLEDMGPRPEGMSLDRIDVNGNYEPGNCRWTTAQEQARNHRNPRLEARIEELEAEVRRLTR